MQSGIDHKRPGCIAFLVESDGAVSEDDLLRQEGRIEGRRPGPLLPFGRFQPLEPDAILVLFEVQIGPLDYQRGDPATEEACRGVVQDNAGSDKGRLSVLVEADAGAQGPGREVVETNGFFRKGQIPQQSRQEEGFQQRRQEIEDGQDDQGQYRQRDAGAS